MTREEQIEKAAEKYATHLVDTDITDFHGKYEQKMDFVLPEHNAFLAGVEWADAHPESPWISVENDLPCNHEEFIETGGHYLKETIYVITVNKYGIIESNYMVLYDDGKWEWKYGATPCYWMPIPESPKE